MSDFDFKALADQVRDALLADPFFSVVPAISGASLIISADPHDIVTEINEALNNIGLGIVVQLPVAHVNHPNEAGPVFDDVTVVISIFENSTVNRSVTTNGGNNPTAYAAAMEICGIIHHFAPIGVDDEFIITACIPVPDDTYVRWEIHAKTQVAIQATRVSIGAVTATPSTPGDSTQTVSLSCATAGAPIWYTLDGTYPSPRNPTSAIYIPSIPGFLQTEGGTYIETENGPTLTPLSVAPGQLLRARAWLAGYAPTNPAELTIQY